MIKSFSSKSSGHSFVYMSAVIQACEKKRRQKSFGARERQEKALCDTASVTQINLINELQHSTAETHIIIQAKNSGLQCCNVGSSAALWSFVLVNSIQNCVSVL